jgi:hypothetical protein
MRSRARPLVALVILLAGVGGATWSSWNASQQISQLDRSQRDLADRVDHLFATLDAVTRAQQAHVIPSPDQDPSRAPALIEQVRAEIERLRPHVRAIEAGRALQVVAAAAAALQDVEGRAQEHLRLGQDLMAGDIIFSEGREADASVAAGLRTLRAAEDDAYGTARAAALDSSWTILGAVAVLWVASVALLTRLPAAGQEASSAFAPVHPVREPAPIEPVRATHPDLQAAADVCTAIGRLTSAEELPRLLQQAASVLEASGIVLWMAAGEQLFAAAAVGYAPELIRRLGPIHRAAINATAAAWRTGALQIVSSHGADPGALVAPMLGPDRCIGVLAVETVREDDPAARAVTSLLAAQLAAALAGWPAASVAPVPAPLERTAGA